MKIILDAMGGDLAPEAAVLGAVDAAKDFGAEITLVGRSEEILEVMRKNGYNDLPKGVEIAGADDVVDMHDDPGRWSTSGRIPPWSSVCGCWRMAMQTPLCLPALLARCSPARL